MDCLFCNIINNKIQTDLVYEDDDVIGFKDINPQAPQHLLFIPRKHISTVNDIKVEDADLIGKLVLAAKTVAKDLKFADDGFRILMNCNDDGGQTVFHIHLHLLAGRRMGWPPG